MDGKRELGDPESKFLASRASRTKEQHPFLSGTGERGGGSGKKSRGDYCPDENNRKRVDEFWTGFNEQKTLCSKTIAEMKEEARKCGEGTTTTGDRARNDAKLVSYSFIVIFCYGFNSSIDMLSLLRYSSSYYYAIRLFQWRWAFRTIVFFAVVTINDSKHNLWPNV